MDMNNFTPLINDVNLHHVRQQIELAKQPYPTRATVQQGSQVLTDYDTFPYTRWWRGNPNSTRPIIAEREAGWRPRHDNCYNRQSPPISDQQPIPYPNHCFQAACNTVYPCYPEYMKTHTEHNLMETMLNKACIVQYR